MAYENEFYPTAFLPKKDRNGCSSLLDELILLLKKILKCCLCCITCGCYTRTEIGLEACEEDLTEEEREAVHDFLHYLNSERPNKLCINEETSHALCILTYSDNIELHRSAALCYAEISDKMKSAMSVNDFEPLLILLRSRDAEVQKAASLAMSNFALNGPESNILTIREAGAIPSLVQLLYSYNMEVQCNACGCLTTLATDDINRLAIVESDGISPLLNLAQSPDLRVQLNATGALLNLTHLQENRDELVLQGVLPVLANVLQSENFDVQYYVAATLSNLAFTAKHRAMILAIGHYEIIMCFIHLLKSKIDKVRCQACLALRNLASDADTQIAIVNFGGLISLHWVVEKSHGATLTAALACLRNLSIHKANESSIIAETFTSLLIKHAKDFNNPEAQTHAAGTIRNLAAGEDNQNLNAKEYVVALITILLSPKVCIPALVEVSAALAVLSFEDACKKIIFENGGEAFDRLVQLTSKCEDVEVQYNCAGTIAQLVTADIPDKILKKSEFSIILYLEKFINGSDESFIHIALWTILQLLEISIFWETFRNHSIVEKLNDLSQSSDNLAVKQLSQNVLMKCRNSE